MLPFLRSDLSQLVSYKPHPGGAEPTADPGHPVILDRLDTNESPYDLPDELKQKLAWVYQHDLEANRYPGGDHGALKGAIAQYINESAQTTWVEADHLSIGNGSDELIRAILIATCLRGEGSILVADPTFSMYGITARTLGIPVITIPRSEQTFEMDLAAAQDALIEETDPPIRVVFVVHPNSPTGNPLTPAELTWLRQIPPSVLVVIDEAYFEFSRDTLVAELPQHPNWIILRTFSKAFRLASHRVGYAIAHPEFAAVLEKVRLPYNLPALSQAAALVTLQNRAQLLPVIDTILGERAKLEATLAAFPSLQRWDSASNFLFVRLKPEALPSGMNAETALEALFQSLKRQGTLIRKTCGGLRITVGTPAENQRTGDRLQHSLCEVFNIPSATDLAADLAR